MTQRLAVTVRGIVQGVGFRPFLHRLAARHGLSGWARNTSEGVALELEGEQRALEIFLHTLRTAPPPLAVLEDVTARVLPTAGSAGFAILPSVADAAPDTLIAPDIATCPACLRELRDKTDRRYRYPFINCTDCGPRFTITRRLPYDRANTSMAEFAMCPDCAAEYADIATRRYHAQPDCCARCGPKLWFAAADGRKTQGSDAALAAAQKLLLQGGILAVKGLGGFHLACRMDTPAPAERLRSRKHREAKPLAVLCLDVAAAKRLCRVSAAEEGWLQSPRRPIVLLQKQEPADYAYLSETDTLGVLLPYTPLHTLLLEDAAGKPLFDGLVMTSANLADDPVLTDNDEALQKLAGLADGFLLHDRAIAARCDDSLLAVDDETHVTFYRRSRGFAPQPLSLPFAADGILALGAEQKASFALGKGRRAFYSQHIGDLKTAATLDHYTEQIVRFEAMFGANAQRLVCDLHPDYASTAVAQRMAEKAGLPLGRVQHHHAHMAACMADNSLQGQVIGLIWDGTGLGTDGQIWGGECLTGGYAAVRRLSSLRPVRLAGGDAATKQIGRVALALALDAGLDADCVNLPPQDKKFLTAMLKKSGAGLNCPQSSGCGRLFDGVYSLLTGVAAARYEGEGAVLLENLAHRAPAPARPLCEMALTPDETGLPRIDTRGLVQAVIKQKNSGVPIKTIAADFHETLAQAGLAMCRAAREETGLTRVVLSGGVWLNRILRTRLPALLRRDGFTVYTHGRVSPGDEGVALGQLAVAAAQQTKENHDVPCSTPENY